MPTSSLYFEGPVTELMPMPDETLPESDNLCSAFCTRGSWLYLCELTVSELMPIPDVASELMPIPSGANPESGDKGAPRADFFG